MRSVAIAVALAAALIVPGRAAGAVHVLTPNAAAQRPDIAVDAAGTAHIAWAAPDAIVYCRVPRGETRCDATTRTLPFAGLRDGPGVNILGTGEIVITVEGSLPSDPAAFANYRVYAYSSTNGGASFAGPRAIADPQSIWAYSTGATAAAGSGGASISLVGVGGGANTPLRYSAVAAATSLPFAVEAQDVTPAASLTGWENGYFASIAFLDGTTPIVASTDLAAIHYRRWSGSGNLNDVATWLADRTLPGDEPKLAGGPSGVYLMYSPESGDYSVRRYDAAASSFGPPTTVSAGEASGGSRDIVEDGSGEVHAVWEEDGKLRRRVSGDGRTWSGIEVLADTGELPGASPIAGFWDARVGAAPDGSGAVVATPLNDEGPIVFTPFAAMTGSSSAPLRIAGKRKLRVNRRGVARLRLRCEATPGSPDCRGRLRLRTRPRVRFAGKRRKVRLAGARFRVEADAGSRVRLRLGSRKLGLVRDKRKARRAVVVAKVRVGSGERTNVRRRLKLVPR